ncbi:MAG: DUF885 domain-containing protein, partial [Gammaproteobacteria bacterium]|nr:DUF885 domain-containing protein [Gammaproteobacteria bacterium]
KNLQQDIDYFKWRHHNYPINQMRGVHSNIPTFLINQHRITSIEDAKAYITRIKGSKKLLEQLIEQLNIRAEKGIIAPKFVFPYVLESSQNIISGMPFTEGDDSPIMSDFRKKIGKLEIDQLEKDKLIGDAEAALKSHLKPAYESFIQYATELEKKADTRDGAWKFPDGEAFFNDALKRTTTTDMTADQIHELGLKEVERIHNEMREIMKKVNFEGDLQAFFDFMRNDPQFYYPNTEEGREAYLTEATALIEDMKTRLDELFLIKPKADVVVKRVEAFREKSAGKAFYQMPSTDGTRPGYYYANLYRMESMPKYQMAALAYHEGIPGHHMQIAINQELTNVPMFRKFARYTAHSEGWGLYSELLPKEIGMYQDPYSDFGRLSMELWRACRLVVDTGIHTKKWTREQGIAFYVNNTPNAEADAVKMVERHIVMPSQATAYKIGMLKLVELREKAREQLGEKFDIREYHDVVLKNGRVPLDVLEMLVDEYIADKSGA